MQRVKYACEMNAVAVALISQTGPGEMSAFGMIFIHMQAAARAPHWPLSLLHYFKVMKVCNI